MGLLRRTNDDVFFGCFFTNLSYNLDVTPEWYGKDCIGIDKGITLLMIENYRTGLIWNTFMKNEYVQLGMKKCGIINKELDETKREAAAAKESKYIYR